LNDNIFDTFLIPWTRQKELLCWSQK